MFTHIELQDLVPKKQKHVITEELVDDINKIASNPEYGKEFRETMLTYSSVLSNSRYSLNEYVNATKFVTLVLLEHLDIDAYKIVFPIKYAELVALGKTRSGISPYATSYKKSKLVSQIFEQTLVPTHVLNAPFLQEAINVTRQLMHGAKSETVQQKAAETLITHLKPPEAAKIQVDVSHNIPDVVKDNESIMYELAEKKLELMRLGADIKEVANMNGKKEEAIIEVEEIL